MTPDDRKKMLNLTPADAAEDLITFIRWTVLHSDPLEGDKEVIRNKVRYWWSVARFQCADEIDRFRSTLHLVGKEETKTA